MLFRSDFEARTGLPRSTIAAQLAAAQTRGWLEVEDERIRATELGWRFLNDVIASFLPEREHPRTQTHGGPPHD